ncbi:RnfABCDGE type electron transport complex subunit D [Puteibacter caeruleilacunae]|nr:RnfABCDGE type electron transport complex subunit D [Puteibacter caeruleilacunae]
MSKHLTVSPSPHVKGSESVQKIMLWVVLAMVPALAWSFMVFGLGAVRTTLTAILACLLFEFVIQKYLLKSEPTLMDGSALVTGILLAFNVPSTLPVWMIIAGALVAMGIGKLSFGGLGNNPFNPALVGRVFLLISFPVEMTLWPVNANSGIDGVTGATPLALLKEGIKSGTPISELASEIPSNVSMLLGNIGGSLGEVSALLLILGGLFMLYKKVITWHVPVSILGTIFAVAGILWMVNPEQYIEPTFHILAGGAMLGAIYMATDMVTSPMTAKGQIIYGIGIGLITITIRVFGAYPEGISFAILIMNGVTPLINRYVKPAGFGRGAK